MKPSTGLWILRLRRCGMTGGTPRVSRSFRMASQFPGSSSRTDRALVGDQDFGRGTGLIHDGLIAFDIRGFARRERHRHRQVQSIGSQVDLGREATTRTAKIFARTPPFFAPAVCWWARTIVLSIIWTVSWPSPLSLRASRMTSHILATVQRRNWRQTELRLPNCSCRSRQGTPVRAIQNTPSRIRRWSAGGLPLRAPSRTRKGEKNAHSSSSINPRTKALLPKSSLEQELR
jgi:hypothetical protein